ncbi:hypothetical protein [Rhizobium sp. RM]|uniref:hypothetical protein n=1 Tax=Rhizobium sp. RM TaxID=2748079 RepID=UPI00110F14D5|nr:hypothetical protein [Rhizobium sp. RM]NWJ24895.1 hypothetical protein [Rhizobium sp. RM]TMV16681.1 hypothetical protein BJG94_19875 [Rhizobium sp. Td3]
MVERDSDLMAEGRISGDVEAPPVAEWRKRVARLVAVGCVVAATAVGAGLPLFLSNAGFQGYVSEARVEIAQTGYEAPDSGRFLTMARRTLLSPTGLDRIASDLKLKPTDVIGVRNQGELGLLYDLLTGADTRPVSPREALNIAVGEAIRLELTADESTLVVKSTAATADAAMRLADYVSMRVMADGRAGTMTPAMREAERARTTFDKAEAAVSGFQMRHGDTALPEVQQLEQQLHDLESVGLSTRQRQQAVEADLTSASVLKANDVLANPLPGSSAFSGLEDLRQRYAAAGMTLANVSIDYGAKHPRRIAAQNAVDDIRAQVTPALRQLVDGLKRDSAQIAAERTAAEGERKKLLDRLNGLGVVPGEFSKLQAELETARNAYLEATARQDAAVSATPLIETSLAKKAGPGELSRDMLQAGLMAGGGALVGLLGGLYLLSYRRHDDEDEQGLTLYDGQYAPSALDVDMVPVQPENFEPMAPAIFDDIDTPLEAAVDDDVYDDEAQTDRYADYYAEAANDADDMPLDERVRQVLMGNRTVHNSENEDGQLPPLMADALSGQFEHEQAEAEELLALRRELALLREHLADYADRRDVYRKTG